MLKAAFMIANAPCPTHSLVPVCLEKILGDAIILWQILALPAEIERVCVITGNDHEKIAKLIADWKSKGDVKNNVECYKASNVAHSILDLSVSIGIEPTALVLLLLPTQPLISPAALQKLASTASVLVSADQSDNLSPAPLSLHCAELKSLVNQLTQQIAEPDWDELFKHILKTVELKPVKCDPKDLIHVQTRRDLHEVQSIARSRIVNHWLCSGAAFMDPGSTFIGPRVELAERGVFIEPQVRLEGKIIVGEGTTIGQGSVVKNSLLGANIEIRPYCVIDASVVEDWAKIGPFAHLREGSQLEANVQLGNFVEIKKTLLHSGVKANHLTYLGDCEVGERTNVGAGCITCNYDGFSKHRTIIGKDAFIGSDCQLIAPVTVGDGAILGAGTTLTSDAPKDALVVTRAETKIRERGAERLRAKLKRARSESPK
jgi:bifunctional UDP-N-acetylglucosamine pyrophosphorylase/glucosamine-1-phosphate N-acetyltransferase